MGGKARRQLINAISPRLGDPQNVEPFKMPRILHTQPTHTAHTRARPSSLRSLLLSRLHYNAISFPLSQREKKVRESIEI